MKIMKIVVAVIIVFILVFAVGKAAGVFKGFGGIPKEEETEGKVKVPNVVGMTEEQAKKALNKKGLGFKVAERKDSKTVSYTHLDVYKRQPERKAA